jgi:hypothetical protein
MEKVIHEIHFIPAVFFKYSDDGNVLLKCLQGEEYVVRAFEFKHFKNITNPKYLILGIITGDAYIQLNLCDGSEYEDLFKNNWNILLK